MYKRVPLYEFQIIHSISHLEIISALFVRLGRDREIVLSSLRSVSSGVAGEFLLL